MTDFSRSKSFMNTLWIFQECCIGDKLSLVTIIALTIVLCFTYIMYKLVKDIDTQVSAHHFFSNCKMYDDIKLYGTYVSTSIILNENIG